MSKQLHNYFSFLTHASMHQARLNILHCNAVSVIASQQKTRTKTKKFQRASRNTTCSSARRGVCRSFWKKGRQTDVKKSSVVSWKLLKQRRSATKTHFVTQDEAATVRIAIRDAGNTSDADTPDIDPDSWHLQVTWGQRSGTARYDCQRRCFQPQVLPEDQW